MPSSSLPSPESDLQAGATVDPLRARRPGKHRSSTRTLQFAGGTKAAGDGSPGSISGGTLVRRPVLDAVMNAESYLADLPGRAGAPGWAGS